MAARKKPFSPSSSPPTSETHQRTSALHERVVFPDDATPSSESPASLRGASEVPAAWLDRLLTLTWELPVAEGEEAVVRAVVDALFDLLPFCGIGACFVGPGGRQQVICRHPVEGGHPGVDPTRLFPGYEHEMILEVPGDSGQASGSTLHAACDDDATLRADGPSVRLLRRAAQVLRRGIDHARTHIAGKRARTEVQTLTSQMVQAEKLASLGQIAAGMVHELNNPLTSIVAYTDYLMKRWHAKRETADPDELERLRRIGESAHRLLRFTRDLVSYARPSGDIPVPVPLHGVIDQALAFCEHVLVESSASVERNFGDGMLPVRGLPEQLTQVFVNLITNACHAMPPAGGTITIGTELADGDGRVRVVVADTGHGISEQNVARVFVPFFTTKGDGRGTGLGLAIVKSIVEGHGGQITVESEPAVREGTQFILLLPVASR
jgi:signal transduction histidine kinase